MSVAIENYAQESQAKGKYGGGGGGVNKKKLKTI